MEVLAHHETNIVSLLRLEKFRTQSGKPARTPEEMALDWYGGLRGGNSFYGRVFKNEREDVDLIRTMAAAIRARERGELTAVGDFSQKRDAICEACPAGRDDCWRKDERYTLREWIKILAGNG